VSPLPWHGSASLICLHTGKRFWPWPDQVATGKEAPAEEPLPSADAAIAADDEDTTVLSAPKKTKFGTSAGQSIKLDDLDDDAEPVESQTEVEESKAAKDSKASTSKRVEQKEEAVAIPQVIRQNTFMPVFFEMLLTGCSVMQCARSGQDPASLLWHFLWHLHTNL
jgi:hypothetical protein